MYGHPELAELVQILTGLLYGFSYNMAFFKNGGPKGILAVLGEMPERQFRSFQRQLLFGASGVHNAYRLSMVNPQGAGADVRWVPFGISSKDMEYAEWNNACFRLACAVFQIDPTEVGYYFAGEGQKSPMFEGSQEAKLKSGKDKGLRPLIEAIEAWLNKYIVWRINPDFEIRFLGLDTMSEIERADLDRKQAESIYTLNQVRARKDEPPIDGGDVVLHPVWLQYHMMREEKAMAAALASGGLGGGVPAGDADWSDPAALPPGPLDAGVVKPPKLPNGATRAPEGVNAPQPNAVTKSIERFQRTSDMLRRFEIRL
jgi:hypothetical protein